MQSSPDLFDDSEDEMLVVEEELEKGEVVKIPKNYQVTGNTLWEERTLMSPFNARPLLIAQVHEGRETLTTLYQNYLDPEGHRLTHYYSDPSWEGGREYYLWSPRGRQVVKKEDCTVTRVKKKTMIKNPMRTKFEPREMEVEGMVEENVVSSRKRKHSNTTRLNLQTNGDHRQRLQAYKWMLEQGRLEGLRVEANQSVCLLYTVEAFIPLAGFRVLCNVFLLHDLFPTYNLTKTLLRIYLCIYLH